MDFKYNQSCSALFFLVVDFESVLLASGVVIATENLLLAYGVVIASLGVVNELTASAGYPTESGFSGDTKLPVLLLEM